MPFSMTIPPEAMPVTVDEVKVHCVVSPDFKDDDKLLETYIKAATIHGQFLTGRQFVKAAFELDLEKFPVGKEKIKLLPELQAVSSVQYINSQDQTVIIPPGEYKVRKTGLRGHIQPIDTWPQDAEDIVIEFEAGWPVTDGATPEDPKISTTPEDIKSWLMVRVAGIYEQREPFVLSASGQFGVASMPKNFIDHVLDIRVVPGLGAGI